MTDAMKMVSEFHEAFGIPSRDYLEPQPPEKILRINLLREEYNEYLMAVADSDIVEVADALADMVYVIYGTALAYGIDLNDVLAEVHRSNMSKLGVDGNPIYRDDGKVMKGPNYFRPEVASVLGLV